MALNELVKLTTLWTTGPWLQIQGLQDQIPAQPHNFMEIDHEISSTVILHLLIRKYVHKYWLTA